MDKFEAIQEARKIYEDPNEDDIVILEEAEKVDCGWWVTAHVWVYDFD